MATFNEQRDAVAQALVKRANAKPDRAKKLASAYLNAAMSRAHSVTVGAAPPPTAFRSAQIGLVLAMLPEFKDVPTVTEVSALLRITKTAAASLMREVQATSDEAVDLSVAAVFATADHVAAGAQASLPNSNTWTFDSLSDLKVARDHLEFVGATFKTMSDRDGSYELLVTRTFVPPTVPTA